MISRCRVGGKQVREMEKINPMWACDDDGCLVISWAEQHYRHQLQEPGCGIKRRTIQQYIIASRLRRIETADILQYILTLGDRLEISHKDNFSSITNDTYSFNDA